MGLNATNLSNTHYIYYRFEAYTWTSLVLGPLAILAGFVCLLAERKYSFRRQGGERLSFRAVAGCEVLNGLMQFAFGVSFHLMLLGSQSTALEIVSEVVNAVYAVSIVFSTATIMQISYLRWMDLHQLRVGGIRPLRLRHWLHIAGFTGGTGLILGVNKVVYMYMRVDPNSRTLRLFHTITYAAVGVIWLGIFIAASTWNFRIIRIARNVRRRGMRNDKAPSSSTGIEGAASVLSGLLTATLPPPAPALDTRWMRLTLQVYNIASVLFILKVIDNIYLGEVGSQPLWVHVCGIVNHILQTTALLSLPVLWLVFCTHFYLDYARAQREQNR